ncbi:hypothetical protein [Oxynema aestuarii]|uniref:Uncharacterized protein n=1 Tax=Oxynema aestuarii AP17 TaxID=2064643 RepID=A0A6H1TS00_9CYAN|nr:hypothetical protein [Oxynema aestuarii]QIZ69374.1 hypothetical protein HCG48_01220 [Oxynema aestuarii AP17]
MASAIYRPTMNFVPVRPERSYAVKALERYWQNRESLILRLPIPEVLYPDIEQLPPPVEFVELPNWATDIAVEGSLLVPKQAIAEGETPPWTRTDWLWVIFWYLNGLAEQSFERQHGPIHSYSFQLKGWDSRLWSRAWVNRIALFLRRWAAREQGVSEQALFGSLPKAEIILTHDVDAIAKTLAIRFKQTAFHSFNAVRSLLRGQIGSSLSKLANAAKFLFSQDNYWCFDRITALEKTHGFRSHFNIYGGPGGWQRTFQELLLDPAYSIATHPKLKQQLQKMSAEGWTIGLHQSFNAWADAEQMQGERQRLEKALGFPVTSCRQHWLRFSWEQTWQAQQKAGFALDSTLGFNDRPGFRTGVALQYHPWCFKSRREQNLQVLPMVLMDSHLYDYRNLSDSERNTQIAYWLDEIYAVHGTASVIWHQRVMSNDYGWATGYETLLSTIEAKS